MLIEPNKWVEIQNKTKDLKAEVELAEMKAQVKADIKQDMSQALNQTANQTMQTSNTLSKVTVDPEASETTSLTMPFEETVTAIAATAK